MHYVRQIFLEYQENKFRLFSELVKLAHAHSQKSCLRLINTWESDILFQWPPGKAPW